MKFRRPTPKAISAMFCPNCKMLKEQCECRKDDIAIKFIDKEDTSKGFVIYARKNNRVKHFAIPFKAEELLGYVHDVESWPEMTADEKARINKLFKRK